MQIFIQDQYTYLFYSLIMGVILGVIYDFLYLFPVILNKKSKHTFLTDFIFTFLWGLLSIIFTYDKNSGIYRWYFFAGSFLSFSIYRITIGKAITKIEQLIFSAIHFCLQYIFTKLFNAIDFSIKFVKIKVWKTKCNLYAKRVLSRASEGFGIRKEEYEKTGYKNRQTKAKFLG